MYFINVFIILNLLSKNDLFIYFCWCVATVSPKRYKRSTAGHFG